MRTTPALPEIVNELLLGTGTHIQLYFDNLNDDNFNAKGYFQKHAIISQRASSTFEHLYKHLFFALTSSQSHIERAGWTIFGS